jgi:hypothetical protein
VEPPVGQVMARTPAGSALSAPGTVARAAPALGTAEIGRALPEDEVTALFRPPGEGDAAGTGPEGASLACTEARPAAAPLIGAEPGGLVGEAQRAPGAGGGGSSNPLSSSGVRAACGSPPSLSGAACRSFMGPPDRRVPTPVETSRAGLYRATPTRLRASGGSRVWNKIKGLDRRDPR